MKCLNVKEWFSNKGEYKRMEFFCNFIVSILFYISIILLEILIITPLSAKLLILAYLIPLIIFIYSNWFIIPLKRIRNLGWNPWFVLFQFIPFIGIIFFLLLLFKEGKVEEEIIIVSNNQEIETTNNQ